MQNNDRAARAITSVLLFFLVLKIAVMLAVVVALVVAIRAYRYG